VKTEVGTDFSGSSDNAFGLTYPVCGKVEKVLPIDAPEPLANHVTSPHYDNANLMHDIAMGRSVTGFLHPVNKIAMEWYSKNQATIETETYGSEFVATIGCVEQSIDLHNTLQSLSLSVPIRGESYMFGNNDMSVVNSSKQWNSTKLHKHHYMLSIHHIGEVLTAGILGFISQQGMITPLTSLINIGDIHR
jgi:hypothetical protein